MKSQIDICEICPSFDGEVCRWPFSCWQNDIPNEKQKMNYEYRCLICDYTWESDNVGKSCPKCGEYNDIYVGESEN